MSNRSGLGAMVVGLVLLLGLLPIVLEMVGLPGRTIVIVVAITAVLVPLPAEALRRHWADEKD